MGYRRVVALGALLALVALGSPGQIRAVERDNLRGTITYGRKVFASDGSGTVAGLVTTTLSLDLVRDADGGEIWEDAGGSSISVQGSSYERYEAPGPCGVETHEVSKSWANGAFEETTNPVTPFFTAESSLSDTGLLEAFYEADVTTTITDVYCGSDPQSATTVHRGRGEVRCFPTTRTVDGETLSFTFESASSQDGGATCTGALTTTDGNQCERDSVTQSREPNENADCADWEVNFSFAQNGVEVKKKNLGVPKAQDAVLRTTTVGIGTAVFDKEPTPGKVRDGTLTSLELAQTDVFNADYQPQSRTTVFADGLKSFQIRLGTNPIIRGIPIVITSSNVTNRCDPVGLQGSLTLKKDVVDVIRLFGFHGCPYGFFNRTFAPLPAPDNSTVSIEISEPVAIPPI
jgi:hypothetical protein